MPAGRPTDYKPEYAAQAEKLCKLGATTPEVADFFGVSSKTIERWAAAHEEFCLALKAGKDAADERVVRSLYHRAIGYSFDAVKIFNSAKGVVTVPYVEHVPPDTTAAIFWLKNRQKMTWRDRQDHEISGPDGGPIKTEDASGNDLARRIAWALAQARPQEP